MNAKQQYREAYRVARIIATMHLTLKQQIDFMKNLKWNFSGDTYFQARKSLITR